MREKKKKSVHLPSWLSCEVIVVGITVAVGVVAETGLAVVGAMAIGLMLAVALAAAAADIIGWADVCRTEAGVVEVIGRMLAILGVSPTGRLYQQ